MFSYLSPHRIGPKSGTLNLILWLIGSISILSAFLDPLMNQLAQITGPQDWFSLSWYGIKRGYIFQPVSYLFVLYSGYDGIGLTFIASLLFYLSTLYVIGSLAIERIGTTSFLFFFLLQGALSGFLTLLVSPLLNQYGALFGPLAPIVGLLVVWTLFNPESELFLLKAKWLTLIILGALLVTSTLSYALLTIFSAFLGYLYTLFAWNLTSPFEKTHKIDHFINHLGISYRKQFKQKEAAPLFLEDEAFIASMLSKIAKSGESSLTLHEKNRLDEIMRK
jgi:hypothetical protein